VQNHLDLLLRRTSPLDLETTETGPDIREYVPEAATQPDRWHRFDQKSELGIAIEKVETAWTETPGDVTRKFQPLREYCRKYPRDVAAKAIYACYATTGLMGLMSRPDSDLPAGRAYANEELEATGGAEGLEPQNALFPLLRSMALRALRRDKEAADQFLDASQKPQFNLHLEVVQSKAYAFESTFGYRGQAVRINALASYLLPEDSLMAPMGQWIIDTQGVPGRVQVARVAKTLALTSPVAINVLVARKLLVLALGGKSLLNKDGTLQMEKVDAAAENLDRLPGRGGFRFVEEVSDIRPLLLPINRNWADSGPNFSLLQTGRTSRYAVSAIVICALLWPLIAIAQFGGRLKLRFERAANALPMMAWLITFAFPPSAVGRDLLAVFGLATLNFLAAWLIPAKAMKYTRVTGYVLAGITLALGWAGDSAGPAVACAYVASDLLSHWEPENGSLAAWVATSAALLLTATLVFFALRGALDTDYGLATVGCIAAMGFAAAPKVGALPKWISIAGVSTAFVVYLLCVGVQIQSDRALATITASWSEEGNNFRQTIGLPPFHNPA
jgi:hypothetical protein